MSEISYCSKFSPCEFLGNETEQGGQEIADTLLRVRPQTDRSRAGHVEKALRVCFLRGVSKFPLRHSML